MEPLATGTLSGKIISDVEAKLRMASEGSTFFRDNLVQDAPLQNGKLRYPTEREMKSEWSSFERRLAHIKSNVVILLGGMVSEFFKSKRKLRVITCPFADGRLLKWVGIDEHGRVIIAAAHPSYIGIYARKRLKEYADAIFCAVQGFLQGSLAITE